MIPSPREIPHCSRLLLSAWLVAAITSSTTSSTWAQLDEAALADAAQRGPAVAALLEMPRDTPDDQLLAIFTLLDLGEFDLVGFLWQELKKTRLDDRAKSELVAKFGTARFLNLARHDRPGETSDDVDFRGSRAFAQQCLDAASKRARDPQRLSKLITALNSDDPAARIAARNDLAATGAAGAVALLESLAQAEERETRAYLMFALAELRPSVDPLLVASLADGTGRFRRDVAELAGHMRLLDAVPWLGAIAAGAESDHSIASAASSALVKMAISPPVAEDARAVLRSEILRLESQAPEFDLLETSEPWWTFDAKTSRLRVWQLSPEAHYRLAINRLSCTLGTLRDASDSDRRLALLSQFQTAQLLGEELPSEVKQLAESLSTDELSTTLAEALENNQFTAAIACADMLGKRGDPAALSTLGSEHAALVAAVGHADRQLRFAALRAVMAIAPQESFAGASAVPQALWDFASGAGAPQAIAASSMTARAVDWAGQLRGLGYDATPVVTGREATRTALESPRLELILLDSDIGQPRLREVVYQFRSNRSTARIPIAVLSSLANLSRAEQLAVDYRRLHAIARPHGNPAMQALVETLRKLASDPVSAELRGKQATEALDWLAQLLEHGQPYNELLREAELMGQILNSPDHTKASLRVLGLLGTAGSQQMLVEFTSAAARPIELRRDAARALSVSVDRFGKLLTSAEILRQYNRYNASETADRDTQELLGDVLDLLENKSTEQTGR